MVNVLVPTSNPDPLNSGSRGPGLSPGQGHCCMFLGKTLYSHSALLHPGEDQHPIQGGVEILLVAEWNKCQQYGLLGPMRNSPYTARAAVYNWHAHLEDEQRNYLEAWIKNMKFLRSQVGYK